jgi:hypothetical protein
MLSFVFNLISRIFIQIFFLIFELWKQVMKVIIDISINIIKYLVVWKVKNIIRKIGFILIILCILIIFDLIFH